jgi:hypothetical protein
MTTRERLAEVWDEGALWAAVECGAIPHEDAPWLVPGDNPYRTRVVRVYKDSTGDWVAEDECVRVYCTEWSIAMEAAYGHICMGHDVDES